MVLKAMFVLRIRDIVREYGVVELVSRAITKYTPALAINSLRL